MQSKIIVNSSLNFPNLPQVSTLKNKVTYIRKNSSGLFDLKAVRYVQKKSIPFQLRNLLWQGVDQIRRILPLKQTQEEILLQDIRRPLQFLPSLGRLEKANWVYEPGLRFQTGFSFIAQKPNHDKLVPIRKAGHKNQITFPLRIPGALKGILLQDVSSYLYLKIDEKFFAQVAAEYEVLWGSHFLSYRNLFPYLKTHAIVVSYSEIQKFHLTGKIKELGSSIYFGIQQIVVESFEDHPEYESVLYVEIESPLLEKIQRKYTGRSSPMKIFLGAKKRARKPALRPLYSTNLAYHVC